MLSLLAHGVIIGLLLLIPARSAEPDRTETRRHVIQILEFPTELTQRAPNKGKISKEFDAVAEVERPKVQIPHGAPSTTRPRAFQPGVQEPLPQTQTAPLPEAPKVENAPPKPDVPQLSQLTPQIEPIEKPKIVLENPAAPPAPVAPGQSKVAIPNASVDEAIRQAVRSKPSGGVTVGDLDLSGTGGIGDGLNLPPTPGVQGSNLELLSDPQGVDFRPYLMQVLAAVRRNWLAVIPESAKLGRRGRVGVQFSISRTGSVPKLVIVTNSGTDALDRAAVAGISASNPFPPLPTEYKGDRVVLQFNFAYNVPKR
ncbi:MAG: TonB family protein [Acidobacteriia bacterium]|nr:TonB family protein [Terriglobia bacterium]